MELEFEVDALAIAVGDAQRETVGFAHPKLERAAGDFQRLEGFGFGRQTQDVTGKGVDPFVRLRLHLEQQREQGDLFPGPGEFDRAKLGRVLFLRRAGETRPAGLADDAEIFVRHVNPELLAVTTHPVSLAFVFRGDGQPIGSLKRQRRALPREVFGEAVHFDELEPDREGLRSFPGGWFDDAEDFLKGGGEDFGGSRGRSFLGANEVKRDEKQEGVEKVSGAGFHTNGGAWFTGRPRQPVWSRCRPWTSLELEDSVAEG